MANRTICALYDNYDDAALTVQELEAAKIPARDISLVANDVDGRSKSVATTEAGPGAGTGAGIGAAAGGAAGLLAGLGMLAIPGVGPVVAAGWLVATAVGAAAGAGVGAVAGGLIGSLMAAGVSREDANVYAEGIRRGGTMVTVKADDDHAATAERIVRRRAVDINARGNFYRESGWKEFNGELPPYTTAEVRAERERYRSLR